MTEERQRVLNEANHASLRAAVMATNIALKESNQASRSLLISALALMKDDAEGAFKCIKDAMAELAGSEDYIRRSNALLDEKFDD